MYSIVYIKNNIYVSIAGLLQLFVPLQVPIMEAIVGVLNINLATVIVEPLQQFMKL